MQRRLFKNILLLVVVAGACFHILGPAQEAAKPDTAFASEAAGKPALEVPEWYFDFGEVKDGSEYLHAFVIRNAGTGVLEIKKVQPG
ncbi:MAG TPA: hypothetical protein PLM79_07810 [Syntrophobacteraceae bacterium]|nr:hypothetical protein [Syntrophobacteraceae bacterium]